MAGLLVFLTALAAGLGPAALYWLARFGQEPPERLPLAAIPLLGAVLAGPLADLTMRLSRRAAMTWLAGALMVGLASAAATLVTPAADFRYFLCPLSAVVLAAVLREMRPAGLAQAVCVYVACTLLANFTLDSFLPVGSFFLVNVGTLFFGVTFTQRDRVHAFGRPTVYRMILLAAIANVALAAALGTPLRYVAVSFLSILLAETADTEVFHRLRSRRWIRRVATSNAVSAPIDTIVFTVLAFAGEEFATAGWMTQVIVTDVLVKYASGILAALGVLALVRSALPRPRPAAGPQQEGAAANGGRRPG
ncbi:MAG TPA: VUT family protein [Trueperaceae bacterium]|nr:VUT family protein [Trueperaceae bacterium]